MTETGADDLHADAALGIGVPIAPPRAAEGWRVALSPYLFESMLVGMAAVAVGIHRTTGSRGAAWGFAKARARNLTALLGVDVRVHGVAHLAGGGPFMFTPNHQSHLDILALLAHLPLNARFAAKRELWNHPVVGSVLDTLGMIPVDRDDPETAIDVLNRAAGRGHSFIVFPEGKRSRDGMLAPFKKGAFVLAIRLGIPVVPVVMCGTRRLMPRGARLHVRPGVVDVHVLAPIATTGLGYDDREALTARVRDAITAHHTGW